jgi:hypothetical protein
MSATPFIGCGVGRHSKKTEEEKKTLGKKIEKNKTILAASFDCKHDCLFTKLYNYQRSHIQKVWRFLI